MRKKSKLVLSIPKPFIYVTDANHDVIELNIITIDTEINKQFLFLQICDTANKLYTKSWSVSKHNRKTDVNRDYLTASDEEYYYQSNFTTFHDNHTPVLLLTLIINAQEIIILNKK